MEQRNHSFIESSRALHSGENHKEKIKIRNFELFNDGKKEMIEAEQADDA